MQGDADDVKRLGRAVVFVHQHSAKIHEPVVRASIEVLLLTGRAMDFAARLRGHQRFVPLDGDLARRYAGFVGLGQLELQTMVLPALKRAGIVDYTTDVAGSLVRVDEYVGVSGTVIEQTVQLLHQLSPRPSDLAFLHSVEIAAMAPLGRSLHLSELVGRGFSDEQAATALTLARSAGINQEVPSAELGEAVIFSPYVWGTHQIGLASFLSKLPPNERDLLLGMSEQVLNSPGIAVSKLAASPALVRSARNAGLIQAATVHSASGGSSTYAFSPLLEAEDNQCTTTEAFHQRKLFTAHILFGHEKAKLGYGRILDPADLVGALVRKGQVGPATNIGTDYHLLEAAGIVAVRPEGGRAYLQLVKPEIAEASLPWIRRITDISGSEQMSSAQAPANFTTPEGDRSDLGSAGESNEVLVASILELRKEVQRAARREDPWS